MDYIPKEDIEDAIKNIERLQRRNKQEAKKLDRDLRALNVALEEENRDVPYRLWQCEWLDCDHGMGLAGRDSCPGDPREADCKEFTTEFSDCTGG